MPISQREQQHAFLGGSNYHWLNYSEEKLVAVYRNHLAAQRGTELHALAHECIRLKVNLLDDGSTLSMYVADAITYNMDSEVMLRYSDHCFGTADTLTFDGSSLRIHDLKTGTTKCSILQLHIYAALWCLSTFYNPWDINFVLRIYQNNNVLQDCPDPQAILNVMDKIQRFDHILNQTR